MKEEFDERNCKLCAIVIGSGEAAVVVSSRRQTKIGSLFTAEDNEDWIQHVQEIEEVEQLGFPLIADDTGEISRMVRGIS